MNKKPVQKRGESKVDLIIQSAIDLFIVNGIEKTSTNAIAKAAKIPIGSLYQFFDDKEAIVRYLMEQYKTETRLIFSTPTISQTFEAVVEEFTKKLLDFKHDKKYCLPLFEDARVRNQLTEDLVGLLLPVLLFFRPDLEEGGGYMKAQKIVRVLLALFAIEGSHAALQGKEFEDNLNSIVLLICNEGKSVS